MAFDFGDPPARFRDEKRFRLVGGNTSELLQLFSLCVSFSEKELTFVICVSKIDMRNGQDLLNLDARGGEESVEVNSTNGTIPGRERWAAFSDRFFRAGEYSR